MPALFLVPALLLGLVGKPVRGQSGAPSPVQPRIRVGPDILVSRDGDLPHVELHVAANPVNARQLVGAAIVGARPLGGTMTKTYASADGGNTWHDAVFPEQQALGGGDPQVAFTRNGTALFVSLATILDDVGRTRAAVHIYRSEDGGRTWGKPADLGYSYDHEQIVADHTNGRYAGRIYLSLLWGFPVYRVGVFRSDDDGRTWVGPVEAANGGGTIGINAANPLVLSDGSLFIPYSDFEFQPDRRKANPHSTFWFTMSTDGGVTYAAPRRIGVQMRGERDDPLGHVTFPEYAADRYSEAFRDRLYVVWTDFRTGHGRLLSSFSSDRGVSWSEPRLVDPSVPNDAEQWQPMAIVNKDGTLGVSWYDSRGIQAKGGYRQYFSASIDGGASFLPPVPVSTAPSYPLSMGNLRLMPSEYRYPADSLRVSLLTAAGRWGSGGDYMGLTAAADGDFHAFWADSRTGTFQAWTAQIRVERPVASSPNEASLRALSPSPPPAPAVRTPEALTRDIEVIFDPVRYDSASGVAELPVRLRNRSPRRIFAPLSVEVSGFGSGQVGEKRDAENAPAVLNASNGKSGDGAMFDYSTTIGGFDALEPGMVSAAVTWKLRLTDPLRLPNMHIMIRGVPPAR